MELIESAQILWRRRSLVGVALALSFVVGVLVAFRPSLFPPGLHPRTHTVGQATAQVLIDTHRSQISDVDPAGAQNLYARATLLSDVLATAPAQLKLAESLRINPSKLQVTPPAGSGLTPIRPTALGTAGAQASTVTPTWLLTVTLDPTLPLVGLTAQAPTVAGARALARGAILILENQVQSSALAQGVPKTRQVVINTISPPVAGVDVQGIRKAFGLVAMAVVFLLACLAIVIWEGSGLAERRRRRGNPSSRLRRELEAFGLRFRDLALAIRAQLRPAPATGPSESRADGARASRMQRSRRTQAAGSRPDDDSSEADPGDATQEPVSGAGASSGEWPGFERQGGQRQDLEHQRGQRQDLERHGGQRQDLEGESSEPPGAGRSGDRGSSPEGPDAERAAASRR